MTTHNSTDSDRLPAAVERISSFAFPLATGPDTPVGPIPLFKIRNLIAEGYRRGVADVQRAKP